MIRLCIVLAALALSAHTAFAASKPAAKPAAAKPPAARTAAPTAHAHPAPPTPAAGFDSGDPANLVGLLNAAGAKAQVGKHEGDEVLVSVTSTAANFSAQFAQCGSAGTGCKAVLFDSLAEGAPSMAQLNGYNQASALCRGYMDKAGKSHVLMSMLLFPDDSRAHVVTALAAWQGCIGDFGNFSKNPAAYLAAAP